MTRSRSLVGRIAWAAALGAGAAALVAAIAASAISAFLLQRAEDRRLHEAAVVLAEELAHGPPTEAHVEAVLLDETEETDHTGLLFAVFDGERRLIGGERRVRLPADGGCATYDGRLRVCPATASNGMVAVAASVHTLPIPLFATAALLAAVLAGTAAWLASRSLSRVVVAPLARLRGWVAQIDVDGESTATMGPQEHVEEVDELRATLEMLLARVQESIEQARRFAANAAHELRTPLTSVRAELEMLAEDAGLSPAARWNVERAERRISELAILVERLLVLAAPRNSACGVAETVSLRDLVDDAISGLSPEDSKRVTTSASDAIVRGDSILLASVVVNAVSNGLKFGEWVEIDVAVTGHHAILWVRDDGPGVPPEARERVFEPFFRAPISRRCSIAGHGLGLALIRHVAEMHGGTASFAEARDGRTTLEVRLPVAEG